MARNNEIIRLAKKAADAWRNTHEYQQAAQIIDLLVEELEKSILAPPAEDNNVPTKASNEPLTLEELREMDGQPVWWDDGDWSCWGIVTVDTDGFWAGIPFLRGRRNQINFEYNIKLNRMKIYRRPPEGETDA